MAPATSASEGIRPSGTRALSSSMTSCGGTPRPLEVISMYMSTDGPAIHPGTTAFTRILDGPSSYARTRVAVRSAPFEIAYPPWAGWGWRVTMDATFTTDPPPRPRRCGSAAFVIWSEPKRLTSMILRQMARSTSSKLWKTSLRNALFTTTSIPPNSSAAAAMSAAQASGSTMLVGTARPRAPSAVTSVSTSSRFASRRAASTTSAPWAASARAAWRPSPGPTPDTTHTLPANNPAAAPAPPAVSLFVVVMEAQRRAADAMAHRPSAPRSQAPGMIDDRVAARRVDGDLWALRRRNVRRGQLSDRSGDHRRPGLPADPLGPGTAAAAPLRAGGMPRLRHPDRRSAPPGLLPRALPRLPRTGHQLRVSRGERVRIRQPSGSTMPRSCAAPRRLALRRAHRMSRALSPPVRAHAPSAGATPPRD